MNSGKKDELHSFSGISGKNLMLLQPITITNSITKDLPLSIENRSSVKKPFYESKNNDLLTFNEEKYSQNNNYLNTNPNINYDLEHPKYVKDNYPSNEFMCLSS